MRVILSAWLPRNDEPSRVTVDGDDDHIATGLEPPQDQLNRGRDGRLEDVTLRTSAIVGVDDDEILAGLDHRAGDGDGRRRRVLRAKEAKLGAEESIELAPERSR